MNKGGKPPEDEGAGTPGWVVSFTDMITLLLAFFVLLQAFAKEQNPDLFFEGQGAFRRAIAGMGIPDILFGKKQIFEGESRKKRYPTEEEEKKITRSRVMDAEDEKIRQIFKDLQRKMHTETADIKTRQINIISTPVEFERSGVSLNAQARKYLKSMALNMKQNLDSSATKIYVVGSAADVSGRQDKWILSARRAQAVADFLRVALRDETGARRWKLISWGSGSGPKQNSRPDAAARKEFIRIAIIGVN